MTSLANVSDHRSNPGDQIRSAVETIGKSADRRKVFEAIYNGKRAVKTVDQIALATGLTPKRVLEEGKKLSSRSIVGQTKMDKRVAYVKDPFFASHKVKILSLVDNPKKLGQLATKSTPIVSIQIDSIRIPQKLVRVQLLTIDDLESIKPLQQSVGTTIDLRTLSEAKFKEGVQKLIGELGKFQDWGGEQNDLYTTKMKVKGKRIETVFAFKGPGTKGKLTPGKMGKNGDQIQRLFKNSAGLYVLQYWSQIDESVVDQMREFAKAKSATEGTEVLFCVIDGQDTQRLVDSYPKYFS